MISEQLEEKLDKLRSEPELWDLFTRKEEYMPPFRDKYNRFPYYLSKERDIFNPKVSKFLVENGFRLDYPDGKEFAVCLTHDIDRISPSKKSAITETGGYLLRCQWKKALYRPLCCMHKKWNPWWNFQEIMDLEEQYGAKSTFFIMSLEKKDQDFNYYANDISAELGSIVDRGWEVGLHGGNEAYKDLEALKRQKSNLEKTLEKRVVGYRSHFLNFIVPHTWDLLEKAGLKYDATFGYADTVGFRAGICHPFKPFNLNTARYINLYEIPLTIMDGTLFDSYMRIDLNISWDITKQLIDTAKKYNGVINILWHNTYIKDDYKKIYIKLLDYCHKKGAAITSLSSIIESLEA